ncbi:hypothetical protein B0J11DRAFT_518702 [Dendryphion nanum]|uniref:Mitochondrial ribosomal protein L27 n=1 Tax=Dendryphion nanum TaxID=256645 RepID=A0A9P9EAC0_9PLEO|nr:hypothetical protein B0J11DRAFT_518702 [Dendryphion nanum]
MKSTQVLFGRLRRLPLTTKQARKGYYKSNGAGVLGHWDIADQRVFRVDYDKVRTFVCPVTQVQSTELTPFVARNIPKNILSDDGKTWSLPKKLTPQEYLRLWKERGDHQLGDSGVGGSY